MKENKKIINILSDIFDISEELITADVTKESLPEWDSLISAQIIMVMELEYNINLTDEQITNIQSFGDIFRIIEGGK